jgi:hypothetical protein
MPIADRANRRQPAATPYQERLRAIGHRLDSGGWRVLCLLEDQANLVVSATRNGETGDAGPEVLTLRLSPPLVRRVGAEARRWRGRRWTAPARAAGRAGAGYQARLRAVGWLCDAHGLREFRLTEDGDDLLLAARREVPTASDSPLAHYRLTPGDIESLLRHLAGLRRATP